MSHADILVNPRQVGFKLQPQPRQSNTRPLMGEMLSPHITLPLLFTNSPQIHLPKPTELTPILRITTCHKCPLYNTLIHHPHPTPCQPSIIPIQISPYTTPPSPLLLRSNILIPPTIVVSNPNPDSISIVSAFLQIRPRALQSHSPDSHNPLLPSFPVSIPIGIKIPLYRNRESPRTLRLNRWGHYQVGEGYYSASIICCFVHFFNLTPLKK